MTQNTQKVLSIAFWYTLKRQGCISCCSLFDPRNSSKSYQLSAHLIRLEGFVFFTPLKQMYTYWFCNSHTVFLITGTPSIEEQHTQHTSIYQPQTWEDRVGKRRFSSLPLCLLYLILFMISGFSFFKKMTWQKPASCIKCSCPYHFKEIHFHTYKN